MLWRRDKLQELHTRRGQRSSRNCLWWVHGELSMCPGAVGKLQPGGSRALGLCCVPRIPAQPQLWLGVFLAPISSPAEPQLVPGMAMCPQVTARLCVTFPSSWVAIPPRGDSWTLCGLSQLLGCPSLLRVTTRLCVASPGSLDVHPSSG